MSQVFLPVRYIILSIILFIGLKVRARSRPSYFSAVQTKAFHSYAGLEQKNTRLIG